MINSCIYLPYKDTGYFSRLIADYIDQAPATLPFFEHTPSLEGLQAAIEARKKYPNNRQLLVEELKKQYEGISLTPIQQENLSALLSENTYTICTAHQPNIFTGHLYFIYKIFHAIKLAQSLKATLSAYNFVPVYYMGSEDADLEELGHINLNGEKLEWKTGQTGAVGRMKVDKNLVKLIDKINGQLGNLPFGAGLVDLFRSCYREGKTIQDATLLLVNKLFSKYGLLILIPDNARLKNAFEPVVKKELLEQFSHLLVEETAKLLKENYKVQAGGREINLFYMTEGVRQRIVQNKESFRISGVEWNREELLKEVEAYPERFSANVILRGVFQEMILPNIAFVGGGGEIAYWLELKKVFEGSNVPYPVLLVRNSFLVVTSEQERKIKKLGFETKDFLKSKQYLLNELVKRSTTFELSLVKQKAGLEKLYTNLSEVAGRIDSTLMPHVASLRIKAIKTLETLEKKMLKAEKRKFDAEGRQISKLKDQLFPSGNLQERVDNFASFYAMYGPEWLEDICNASQSLEHQFGILSVM